MLSRTVFVTTLLHRPFTCFSSSPAAATSLPSCSKLSRPGTLRSVSSWIDSLKGAHGKVHSMKNMRHRPKESLHVSTPTWWLKSRFHFSFAGYYNPDNMNYGVLRVLNDDLVKPRAGFGTHPHKDAEIFTYIVEGQLTHQDSMGSAETLGRGCVQYMSAGRGITHSEMNNGDETLHFLQIWIRPDKNGLTPNYGSRVFSKEDRHNKIQHVVTSYETFEANTNARGLIPIHQDANIYVSEADAGVKQEFALQKNRQAYTVCIEGALTVNDKLQLAAGDALEVEAPDSALVVKLEADKDKGSHFLLIEMPRSS